MPTLCLSLSPVPLFSADGYVVAYRDDVGSAWVPVAPGFRSGDACNGTTVLGFLSGDPGSEMLVGWSDNSPDSLCLDVAEGLGASRLYGFAFVPASDLFHGPVLRPTPRGDRVLVCAQPNGASGVKMEPLCFGDALGVGSGEGIILGLSPEGLLVCSVGGTSLVEVDPVDGGFEDLLWVDPAPFALLGQGGF